MIISRWTLQCSRINYNQSSIPWLTIKHVDSPVLELFSLEPEYYMNTSRIFVGKLEE